MRDIFGTICLAGAIQAVLLFFVLIGKKNNRIANRYLALFIFFLALDALELYFGSRGTFLSASPYQLSIIPYSFVFGPSVFFYSALLTARIDRFSGKHALLYVPFVILLAANVVLFFAFKAPRPPGAVIYANMIINGGGLLFEALLYAASLLMIQKYIRRLKEYFSVLDALRLSLFRASLVVLILIVLVFFVSLMRDGFIRREYKLPDVIAVLISLGFGFGVAFLAMLQPEIFNRVRLAVKAVPDPDAGPSPRYEKLRLPESTEERYAEELRRYMEEEKPYLREDLTLQDLADGMTLPAHLLSMILNIRFRQNFYHFINSYRVEEVKRKLARVDYRDRNILTIAYSSGFNSKSTFNTMFKKFTGKTPKEYRADLSA